MTINRSTGKKIEKAEHLKQSINDILTTRIGSRVARRAYGSLLPDLIDAPMNPETNLKLIAASVMALMQHEPRLALTKIQIYDQTSTGLTLLVDGRDSQGNTIGLDVSIQLGSSV